MKKMDWLFGALVALLGLLLIIMPKFWICAIVVLIGLGLIAYGIYNLKVTRGLLDNTKYKKSILIKGIANIVIGVFAILFPMAFGKTVWNAMVYLLAIYLIISAAIGFYSVTLLKDSDVERKKYVWENLALLIIAIVLFLISPNKLGLAIVRIIGILVMIVGGVLALLGVKSAKEIVVAEADVSDDSEESGDKE